MGATTLTLARKNLMLARTTTKTLTLAFKKPPNPSARTIMAVWMPSPVSGSMCPAASPMMTRWSSWERGTPCEPRRSAAAFMRSTLALGPTAREMKGSLLSAPSCSRFRSASCVCRRHACGLIRRGHTGACRGRQNPHGDPCE